MSTQANAVDLAEIRAAAERLLHGAREGAPLDSKTRALIEIGVRAAVSCLDVEGSYEQIEAALDAGASAAQVQLVLTLVSGLGVHTLFVGSKLLAAALAARGEPLVGPLDEERRLLRERCIGDDRYWEDFEREVPGFLDALLRLSPAAFAAFFDYCAVPWRHGALSSRTLELVAVASDATPTHRFMPGVLLHVRGALRQGAGRREVIEALELAANAPAHRGVASTSVTRDDLAARIGHR